MKNPLKWSIQKSQHADGAERSWYWAGKQIFPKIQADEISQVA